jgi:hypothetical protein
MLWKKCFDQLAIFLFLTALLCGSAQVLTGQDSASNAFWKDGATELIWTVKDNGSNVNWAQAGEYCGGLSLGGYSDWRLPTIDELEALYDSSLSKQFKAKGPIALDVACALSGTTNSSGEVWSFCFSYGGRSLGRPSGHSSTGRALCVRGPGK